MKNCNEFAEFFNMVSDDSSLYDSFDVLESSIYGADIDGRTGMDVFVDEIEDELACEAEDASKINEKKFTSIVNGVLFPDKARQNLVHGDKIKNEVFNESCIDDDNIFDLLLESDLDEDDDILLSDDDESCPGCHEDVEIEINDIDDEDDDIDDEDDSFTNDMIDNSDDEDPSIDTKMKDIEDSEDELSDGEDDDEIIDISMDEADLDEDEDYFISYADEESDGEDILELNLMDDDDEKFASEEAISDPVNKQIKTDASVGDDEYIEIEDDSDDDYIEYELDPDEDIDDIYNDEELSDEDDDDVLEFTIDFDDNDIII